MIKKELVAPCGLYCGVCGIYQATVKDDQNLKEKLAKAYGDSSDRISCRGCLSDKVYWYCSVCSIKSCAIEKKLDGCHQCDQFPCDIVDSFPVPEGEKNILRAVPEWRKLGTEDFIAAEEKRFICPQCRTTLFRGARKCRICGTLWEPS
ncbi:MAG: hypothetical protein CVU71_04705 [Deltaproteobacteria bacterium HGW-Deltaproteobacteria-6]|jgi:hypothetical protein|nr:MAG: hypothetical protein CVU71_04705 [Deltaproteobacteria bacterium HGW-Deltaproteobacteria-6]